MVSFVRSTATRHTKIGCARSPEKRLAGLQTSTADELKLLGEMDGEPDDEAALHEQSAAYRLHGEWFKGDIDRR